MITVAIPTYNHGHLIEKAINSVFNQLYKNREILVIDDCSSDNTELVCTYWGDKVRYLRNEKNLGIGPTLTRCVKEAKGEYVVFLCADDTFTNHKVLSDIVESFEKRPPVDIVGRYYYHVVDGVPRPIAPVHDDNIITSSCNPSGVAFRKKKVIGEFPSTMFNEVPTMVYRMLENGSQYRMLKYDTVAALMHHSVKGQNTGTTPSYYRRNPPEVPTENWNRLVPGFVFYEGFVQLKNNSPHLLWPDVAATISVRPQCLLSPKFWFSLAVAVLVPRRPLRHLCDWYRKNIQSRNARIIKRSDVL